MISKGCKRLAEVDFPIAELSANPTGIRQRRHQISHQPASDPIAFRAGAVADGRRVQELIHSPARLDRHKVTKVAHYYLSVDAMTKPMQVREDTAPYGGKK